MGPVLTETKAPNEMEEKAIDAAKKLLKRVKDLRKVKREKQKAPNEMEKNAIDAAQNN